MVSYRIASHRVALALLSSPKSHSVFSSSLLVPANTISCYASFHPLLSILLPPSPHLSPHSLLGDSSAAEAEAETAENRVAHALPGVGVNAVGDLLNGIQHADVFVLELLERGVQLVVPRVQDENLETEGRRGDGEVRQRDEARDNHLGFCFLFVLVYVSCMRFVVDSVAPLRGYVIRDM